MLFHVASISFRRDRSTRASWYLERVVVAEDTEIITWIGDGDSTRRMLQDTLAVKEEYAENMLDLLGGFR